MKKVDKNIEIERKYLVRASDIPFDYKRFRSYKITQGFISLKPAIRIRKSNNIYFLTIKTKFNAKTPIDNLAHYEYETEISRKTFNEMAELVKGRMIYKTRYNIPYKCGKMNYNIELDVFDKDFKGLVYAEVEFDSIYQAERFKAPTWFYRDVTSQNKYKNTSLSICKNVKSILKY